MSSRASIVENDELSQVMRLRLFYNTACSAEDALALNDEDITPDLLIKKGVRTVNMAAAGVGPKFLKRIGVDDCMQLRTLGFDALFLADAEFAAEACAAYGADRVIEVFLLSASDAVAIAGRETAHILGTTAQNLLEVCAGAATEARAVLEQLPSGVSLNGVSAETLLDTGLRKTVLSELGYSLATVASQTRATPQQLAKLGFTVG